jgi:sugar phosphate isomerase/epimerase
LVPSITRRRFLAQSTATAAGAWLAAASGSAAAGPEASGPGFQFPSAPRERIAVSSYPFRNFIVGPDASSSQPMDVKDFAAHVQSRFHIDKIEPWSAHFASLDPEYLEQFRFTLVQAGSTVVNIAVDGEHSPYSADIVERRRAVAFGKQWVDVALAVGSSSIRTNIPPAGESKPDLVLTADSLQQIVAYASARNVVVNLENDNLLSEDPFFLVQLIEKVASPWLRALPDFCNTLAHHDADYAYRGIDAMFGQAYCICHVKDSEIADNGKPVQVDMAKTFGYLKQHGYKGYCSMEWDSPGDPYQGTARLIEQTVRYLS